MSITLPQAAFTIHTVVKLDDWSNATSETIWEGYGNFINYVRLEKVSGTLKITASFNGTTREASTAISYSGYYFITCIVREGSTDGLQVFVNNSEQSYDTIDNRDSTGLTLSGDLIGCYLGKGKSNPNNPLDGKIDQLIPFDRALTAQEISDIYNSGDGLQHKDLDGTETFYNNIVAWYDFNVPKNFGRNYAEESHAVTLDGFNNQFTGTSSDFATSGSSEKSFSMGGWLYWNGGNGSIVGYLGTAYGATFGFNSSRLTFFIYGSGGSGFIGIRSPAVYSTAGWYHFVCTYNGSGLNTGLKYYINGSEVTPNSFEGTYTNMEAMTGIRIGFSIALGRLTGKVDEFFYYDGNLTAPEVSTLYNGGTVAEASTLLTTGSDATNPASLVSSWSFNEQDPALVGQDVYGSNDLVPTGIVEADLVGGKDSLDLTEVSISSSNAVLGHISGKAGDFTGVTRWTDRSGNGNDATQNTLANVPTWLEDQLNTTEDVVYFDGGTTAQWVDLPTNTGYMDGVTDKPYTWCFLFRQLSLRSNNFLLGEATNPYSWSWYINSSGGLVARSFDKSVNAYKSFGMTITSLDWVYLAVSYSASNGFTAYLNGVDQSVTTSTTGSYVAMEDLPVRLGNYSSTAGNTFHGYFGQTLYFEKELGQPDVDLVKSYYNEKYSLGL